MGERVNSELLWNLRNVNVNVGKGRIRVVSNGTVLESFNRHCMLYYVYVRCVYKCMTTLVLIRALRVLTNSFSFSVSFTHNHIHYYYYYCILRRQ